MRSLVCLVVAGAFAAALAGCGSNTKCGAGTILVDGVCQQINPMDCDPETAELVNGVCQAKPGGGTCGPGTRQNPSNPEECIPDCGAGTALDPVTKKCVPAEALIQPDTEEQASDEPNDPMMDDYAPIDFTLPGEGGSTILAGVVSAPIDVEGYLYADYDAWKFTTTKPTLLLIEGLPVSHIRFAFWIAPASDPTAAERIGFDANADQAVRQVWLDRADDWVIVVTDANNLNDLFHQILGLGADAPVGSDDSTFNYAFRVTNMARPEDATIQPATPLSDAYSEGVRFYSMNPTVGQIVEFWNVPTGAETYPATSLYVGDTQTPRSTNDILTLARAAGQELHFVVDHYGSFDVDLSAQYLANVVNPTPLGVLSAPVTRPGDAVSVEGTSMYYTFSISAPTIIHAVAAPGTGPLEPVISVYDASMNLVAGPSPDYLLTRLAPTQITEYVLRVTDASFGGGSTYSFDLTLTPSDGSAGATVAEVEPNDTLAQAQAVTATLPVLIAGGLSTDSDYDLYKVTLPTGMTTLVVETLPGLGATVEEDTIVTLGTSAGSYINDNDDIDYGGGNYYSRLVETGLTPGDYLVAVEGYYGGDYLLYVAAR